VRYFFCHECDGWVRCEHQLFHSDRYECDECGHEIQCDECGGFHTDDHNCQEA
jgi:predicted RNA-binding Zn-ribbon protein involved in translation (DUF1610 family)